MNLFITGGSGFIGQNLLKNEIFLKYFKKIYCLSRGTKLKSNKKIIWIKGDLNSNLIKYLKKSDLLLHLASHSANKPYDTLLNCFKWNCLNSIKFIDRAFKAGVKNFLIVGSYYEYGFTGEVMKKNRISPKNISLPISTYALSKSFFFQTLFSWSLGKNISIKYLRLPHVFGDGELKSRLWPKIKKDKLKKLILQNPNYITNFISIKKLLNKINYYKNKQKFKKKYFEIINILGNDMSLYKFAMKEKKTLGSKIKILKSKDKKNSINYLLPKNQKLSIKIK